MVANPVVVFQRGSNPAEYYALTSYGGNGGTRSYKPSNADPTLDTVSGRDGIFHVNGRVGFRDVTDGASNTLLFGERSHFDPDYDAAAAAASGPFPPDPISKKGWWAASGNPVFGIGDVTLSTFVRVNYTHPPGTPIGGELEDRRVCASGASTPAGRPSC